ncbi:MAG: Serine protease, DegP/HtrA, do-like [Candidatus Carbobacillus altaicus]|uniref:Serine protease, DegP/HtrA, do-like n=1 Tax=Candidatus Carbonibacillus altaicus TaxID=2163959 RepID=A0A2R6Y449_9BACL|nr:MAG: Serine protease, DegP/HtrA, do-like [Candidatus Carbobacillus altaicus]
MVRRGQNWDGWTREVTPRRSSSFFTALFGALLGAGLMILLFQFGITGKGWALNGTEQDTHRPEGPNASTQDATAPEIREGVQEVRAPTPALAGLSVSDIVASVADGVVGVINLSQAEDFWSRTGTTFIQGSGSGIIFEDTGEALHIATNHHVIEGAHSVEILLPDGERVRTKILGSDRLSDLAVLSIPKKEGRRYTVLTFGNSDDLKPGDATIAIGNPLGLDYLRTVTAGVISATNRSIAQDLSGRGEVDWELDVLQTDAAINPGNSGGALINMAGEVIGIASAKISEVGVEGIGFAIPSNTAYPVLKTLLREGRIERAYMGITPKDLTAFESQHKDGTFFLPDHIDTGVVVIGLDSGGPAEQSGIREMDVIVQLDDVPVPTSAAFRKYLYTHKKPGDTVHVTFYRDGKEREGLVKLGKMP